MPSLRIRQLCELQDREEDGTSQNRPTSQVQELWWFTPCEEGLHVSVSKGKKIAVGVVLLVLLAALVLAALVPLSHLGSQFTQIGTYCDMTACVQYLDEYQEQNGKYPSSYSDALPGEYLDLCRSDRWGNPYFYESSPEGFVLVSLGKHGEADFDDYWELRASLPDGTVDSREVENALNVLGQSEADQIVTDRGWYQHGAP